MLLKVNAFGFSLFSSDYDVSSSQGDVGSSKVVINDEKR
jgi:hypothetical protein